MTAAAAAGKRWAWAAVTLALVALIAAGLSGARHSAGSTLSRGALGWRGLAAVLETEGVDVSQLRSWPNVDAGGELPLDASADTLIVSFPWQSGMLSDLSLLRSFVTDGGTLVLGYSGSRLDISQLAVLAEFGLTVHDSEDRPSLTPWRWFKEQSSMSHRLERAVDPAAQQTLSTSRLSVLVKPLRSDELVVYASDADNRAVVSSFPFGKGTVLLIPTTALSNAFLHRPGNAALLLSLLPELGDRVVFDEIHHGVLSGPAAQTSGATKFLDRVVLQLLALYGFALLGFAWRFGPSWPRRTPAFDSHRAFLVGLGALHARLGHQSDAARLLITRLGSYAPNSYPPERLQELEDVARSGSLLEVARRAGPTHTAEATSRHGAKTT